MGTVINDVTKRGRVLSFVTQVHKAVVCLVSIVELRTFGGLLGFSSEQAKGNGLVLGVSG